MAKYFELAEKISEIYGEEMMCAIIARLTDEEIDRMISEL